MERMQKKHQSSRSPRVALESTVITHGLPPPENLQLARDLENIVRQNGAEPATIALLGGKIRVGLTDEELSRLASSSRVRKVSRRDIASALLKKEDGGTTVAATMHIAYRAGIRVFATGGIGGVHDRSSFDVSADLIALAEIPMIVVCAGAKAILDLPATVELLETLAVPVIGYQTDQFPAFYSRQSGLSVSVRLDSPAEIVDFASHHWSNDLRSSVLVCQPLPEDQEIPTGQIGPMIDQARREAEEKGIHGQKLTPFLLSRLLELSGGASLKANLLLLRNNAALAAQIACAYSLDQKTKAI